MQGRFTMSIIRCVCSNLRQAPWTSSEEILLEQQVQKYGTNNWAAVARAFVHTWRSSMSCKKQYVVSNSTHDGVDCFSNVTLCRWEKMSNRLGKTSTPISPPVSSHVPVSVLPVRRYQPPIISNHVPASIIPTGNPVSTPRTIMHNQPQSNELHSVQSFTQTQPTLVFPIMKQRLH